MVKAFDRGGREEMAGREEESGGKKDGGEGRVRGRGERKEEGGKKGGSEGEMEASNWTTKCRKLSTQVCGQSVHYTSIL